MCLVLVDIRTCFWMELPSGPPERGGQLPDRVHGLSDKQVSGRGAAAGQCELDRVHQEKHNCESSKPATSEPMKSKPTETQKQRFYSWMFEFWKMCFFYFKFYQSCLGEHGWDLCWWPGQTTGFAVSDSWSHPDSPRTFGGNGKPLTHLQKENPGTIETQHGGLLLTSSAAEWTGVRLLIFDISGAEPRESIKNAVISDTFAFFLSHS